MEEKMYEKTKEVPPHRFAVVCEEGYIVTCESMKEAKKQAIIHHRIFKELLCDGVTVYKGYFVNFNTGRLTFIFEY